MSLFIKCTLRWQIWTNKKLLLVLFLCTLNGKFWRQFDKQITVSSPNCFNVFSHMRLHGSPVAWTKWRFSTYYIDAHILAKSFEFYTPLFSFPVGIARFSFYFPSSFRSNLICSNIYMVITTKLDKCKCVCFQRVIMVSACFVTRSCAELLQ